MKELPKNNSEGSVKSKADVFIKVEDNGTTPNFELKGGRDMKEDALHENTHNDELQEDYSAKPETEIEESFSVTEKQEELNFLREETNEIEGLFKKGFLSVEEADSLIGARNGRIEELENLLKENNPEDVSKKTDNEELAEDFTEENRKKSDDDLEESSEQQLISDEIGSEDKLLSESEIESDDNVNIKNTVSDKADSVAKWETDDSDFGRTEKNMSLEPNSVDDRFDIDNSRHSNEEEEVKANDDSVVSEDSKNTTESETTKDINEEISNKDSDAHDSENKKVEPEKVIINNNEDKKENKEFAREEFLQEKSKFTKAREHYYSVLKEYNENRSWYKKALGIGKFDPNIDLTGTDLGEDNGLHKVKQAYNDFMKSNADFKNYYHESGHYDKVKDWMLQRARNRNMGEVKEDALQQGVNSKISYLSMRRHIANPAEKRLEMQSTKIPENIKEAFNVLKKHKRLTTATVLTVGVINPLYGTRVIVGGLTAATIKKTGNALLTGRSGLFSKLLKNTENSTIDVMKKNNTLDEMSILEDAYYKKSRNLRRAKVAVGAATIAAGSYAAHSTDSTFLDMVGKADDAFNNIRLSDVPDTSSDVFPDQKDMSIDSADKTIDSDSTSSLKSEDSIDRLSPQENESPDFYDLGDGDGSLEDSNSSSDHKNVEDRDIDRFDLYDIGKSEDDVLSNTPDNNNFSTQTNNSVIDNLNDNNATSDNYEKTHGRLEDSPNWNPEVSDRPNVEQNVDTDSINGDLENNKSESVDSDFNKGEKDGDNLGDNTGVDEALDKVTDKSSIEEMKEDVETANKISTENSLEETDEPDDVTDNENNKNESANTETENSEVVEKNEKEIGFKYEVKEGDNLSEVINDRLHHRFDKADLNLPDGIKKNDLSHYMYSLFPEMTDAVGVEPRLTPEQWQELGISSGNPNIIKPGEEINVDMLIDKYLSPDSTTLEDMNDTVSVENPPQDSMSADTDNYDTNSHSADTDSNVAQDEDDNSLLEINNENRGNQFGDVESQEDLSKPDDINNENNSESIENSTENNEVTESDTDYKYSLSENILNQEYVFSDSQVSMFDYNSDVVHEILSNVLRSSVVSGDIMLPAKVAEAIANNEVTAEDIVRVVLPKSDVFDYSGTSSALSQEDWRELGISSGDPRYLDASSDKLKIGRALEMIMEKLFNNNTDSTQVVLEKGKLVT